MLPFGSRKRIPDGGAPLVVFSHGFHGANTQSAFLMKALSAAGYLVVAPNHKDAMGQGQGLSKTDESLAKPASWNDKSHEDRRDDLLNLIAALHKDPNWQGKIDWSKLVLCGHSLGGYTVLGCAGAWPSWKIPEVKAVLALSPYCQPFSSHNTLSQVKVPIMYQSGTRDIGILPFIKRPGGAYEQTGSPTYLVVFDKVNHFSFSNLNHDAEQKDLINHYSVAFLDKCVLGKADAKPETRLKGVTELDVK